MVNQRVSFVPARHYNKQVILLCSPKLPITSCKKNVYLRLKKQDTSCKKFFLKKISQKLGHDGDRHAGSLWATSPPGLNYYNQVSGKVCWLTVYVVYPFWFIEPGKQEAENNCTIENLEHLMHSPVIFVPAQEPVHNFLLCPELNSLQHAL